MTKHILAALLLCSVSLPLFGDFSAIARSIDREQGVKRVWIPFLGLARTAVRIIQPEGVRDFQLVTFKGAENVDGRKIAAIVKNKMAPGYQPLVQVWSRKSGDRSLIYARPYADGNRVELIVLAQDNKETVLVRVDIDASVIARHLEHQPRSVTVVARR